MATKSRVEINIIDAITAKQFIGDALSPAQEVALRALYALPLTDAQREIFTLATGIEVYTPREYREALYVCGRRSGKSSRLGSNIAIFEAAFRRHTLDRGERGHVIVISPTKKQSGVVYAYILSRLESSPTLRGLIDGEPRRDEVDLVNGITLSVWPANFRSVRGISIVCAVADELAFWFDDATGANPASEVLRAIRPGMANFPNAKLVKVTSPFAKQGVVWEDYSKRAERPEMLVWRLDTRTMNPAIDAAFLNAEEKRDPESFEREYNAAFYESTSAFLPAAAIEACIKAGRVELPPQEGTFYTAALDAAFKGDFFAFSIVHRAGEKVVEDFIRSWRGSKMHPVNLSQVLAEVTETLRRYGVTAVHGDSFCAEPIRQALAAKGVRFVQMTTLGTRASSIWNSLRTLVTSGNLELLEDPAMVSELKRLELIVTAGGNQRVEASVGHDDRAVTLALASHQAIALPVREPWSAFVAFPRSREEESWSKV
jgi:hypothetical protein